MHLIGRKIGRSLLYRRSRNEARHFASRTQPADKPKPSIIGFPVGPFRMNMYALACSETGDAAIVDSGADTEEEFEQVSTFVEENGFNVRFLLQTHAHVDHIIGIGRSLAFWGGKDAKNDSESKPIQAFLHLKERWNWENAPAAAMRYSFYTQPLVLPSIDSFQNLDGKEELQIGNLIFKVLFTPGHSPGHCSFLCEEHKLLIGGDLLFNGSIGRTDLPGSCEQDMKESLQTIFDMLEDDVVVLPGHGQLTTIGQEREMNPLVQLALSQ